MPKNDGGPAYPDPPVAPGMWQQGGSKGMSLRDVFARDAMIGVLGSQHGFLVDVGIDNVAGWAYDIAQKMVDEKELRDAKPD